MKDFAVANAENLLVKIKSKFVNYTVNISRFLIKHWLPY